MTKLKTVKQYNVGNMIISNITIDNMLSENCHVVNTLGVYCYNQKHLSQFCYPARQATSIFTIVTLFDEYISATHIFPFAYVTKPGKCH